MRRECQCTCVQSQLTPWRDSNPRSSDSVFRRFRMPPPQLPMYQDCHELWSKKRRRQMREQLQVTQTFLSSESLTNYNLLTIHFGLLITGETDSSNRFLRRKAASRRRRVRAPGRARRTRRRGRSASPVRTCRSRRQKNWRKIRHKGELPIRG
jgi:hypothetical protein